MEGNQNHELSQLDAFIDEQRKLGVSEEQIAESVQELKGAAQSAPLVDINVHYVGGWARLVSAVIDGVIVWVLNSAFSYLFSFSTYSLYYTLGPLYMLRYFLGFGILGIPGVLYLGLMIGHNGQTIGKLILGQRVVRTDFSPLGYGRAFLRYTIGYFLSGIVFGIGYLAIFFNKQKRGWHDRIAGSVVIHTN